MPIPLSSPNCQKMTSRREILTHFLHLLRSLPFYERGDRYRRGGHTGIKSCNDHRMNLVSYNDCTLCFCSVAFYTLTRKSRQRWSTGTNPSEVAGKRSLDQTRKCRSRRTGTEGTWMVWYGT